ncbi:MAG: sulfatase [Candidatus Aminicenantes bacterium]|jgi:membrane-anchored protein YejM (alkaline phosphatase superfamily)
MVKVKRVISLFLLVVLIISCGGVDSRMPKNHFNVVLISLDTTRSDYVDTGVGARAFTPELKRIAQKSIVFERAYCTIPQTLPSHLSVLTSYFPHECGVYSNQFKYDGRHTMLQQFLKEKGYMTAAVISLGTLASSTGIAKGFSLFRENLNPEEVFYTIAERVTQEALQLLEQIKKEKFFLFLHYSDPHSPYAPPRVQGHFTIEIDGKTVTKFNAHQGAILRKQWEIPNGLHHLRFTVDSHEDFDGFVIRRLEFRNNCSVSFENIEFSAKHYGGAHVLRGNQGTIRVKCQGNQKGSVKLFQIIPLLTWKAAINYYRREVEYMDRYVGKFLRSLEKEKLLDHTIVVITGDHGEGLGEREKYFGHVRFLNQQFIHVPLIMYFPGMKPKRISTPVSLVGISPTLLEFMKYKNTGFKANESLITIINRRGTKNQSNPRPVYSFAFKPSALEDKRSIIHWPYQCIFSKTISSNINREFYNLSLSQSFRKWDEYSAQVIMRISRKSYFTLQKAIRQWNGVFAQPHLVNSKTQRTDTEQLKSMGYLQ